MMLRYRVLTGLAAALVAVSPLWAQQPIDVGSRLELMVDEYLIDQFSGGAELRLHRPTPQQVAIVHDEPWEGNNCFFHTVFQDGELYRMYYRGRQLDWKDGKVRFPHRQVVCYAESTDGIGWRKPELGLVEFNGSKNNNIIYDGVGSHNFAPFLDPNPDCAVDAKYKALGGIKSEGGLFAFKSADGIHWSLMSDKPVITEGAFDSQNLAFWDTVRGEYREYHRNFRDGRDIMTATSKDFGEWTKPVFLEYSPGRITQLYTNQIAPYYRAPHIFLGFPTRYVAGRGLLGPLNEQIARASKRFGTDYTDSGFMTSRDGQNFNVWGEAFIRPGLEGAGRWVYGDNYQNWGIVETKSHIAGVPNELSIYATEGAWRGHSISLRRYTVRIDGFVSVGAPASGGQFVTKPLRFEGSELVLNFSTSAAGSLRVEIQNEDGQPVEGFALADCPEIFGDTIEHTVSWTSGSDVRKLAGQPVRLRFVIKDADLFSLRFR